MVAALAVNTKSMRAILRTKPFGNIASVAASGRPMVLVVTGGWRGGEGVAGERGWVIR